MKHIIICAVLSVALAGCGQEADYEVVDQGIAPGAPQMSRSFAIEESADNFLTGQGDNGAAQPAQTSETAQQFIAYTYSLGLSLPQPGVEPVMQSHISACEAAGPTVCIITNSSVNNQSDNYTTGYLALRAVPSWIETFQAGLDEEVAAAKGDITQRNKQSVDLTRQILDTDARLNAKITLQGRLEDLLATREGDLGELLQVERELARVTGEIESITSNLKALRLRVSMSDMTINYSTKRSLVSGGRSNPLMSAFGDFFYNMSSALAAVITFFAVGLPWMVLTAIFLFIWLRGIWPRVRKAKSKP